MQTLFIPDSLQINFLDANNRPWRQAGILVGIATKANYRNDIDIYPFLTDESGSISIKAEDIQERYLDSVSYGLMDYSHLETAKPDIEFYYWGSDSINRCIAYWRELAERKEKRKKEGLNDLELRFQSEIIEIERKERERLTLFENCFNRHNSIQHDTTLVKDSWGEPSANRTYLVHLNRHST